MQQELWYESFEEALKAVVDALGGPKAVGCQLWPTKDPQSARQLLMHCLNPERQEKLALEEILWIIRTGAAAGCHTAMYFLCDQSHYQRPGTMTKEVRRADLDSKLAAAFNNLEMIRKQLERE